MIGAMKRVNIYLTEQQLAQLRQLVNTTGLTMAELVRRALDAFLAIRMQEKS